MYVRIQNHGSEGNDSISQQTGHILLHISSIKIFFRGGFYLLKMEHQEGTKHNEHTPDLYIVRMHTTNTNSHTRQNSDGGPLANERSERMC